MQHILHALSIAALIFGFGFIVFFHELGHFLAAKAVGIKVEQFAIGFFTAVCSWRQGLGFRWGSSRREYEDKILAYLREHQLADKTVTSADAVAASGRRSTEGDSGDQPAAPDNERNEFSDPELSAVAAKLGLGETEYRLNWIPLGGYVKMLGQDDMMPGAEVDDPRAYNRKSIGARMFVVSAGVIMNVILGALLFMVLFLIGFNSPPPVIGSVLNGSPAQRAGLQVGDRILYINGQRMYDFTKIMLASALLRQGHDAEVVVNRPGIAHPLTFHVRPQPMGKGEKGLLAMGMGPSYELRGPKVSEADANVERLMHDPNLVYQEPGGEILPGDSIIAINGSPLLDEDLKDYGLLYRAIQQADGKPVEVTVVGADQKVRTIMAMPHFQSYFAGDLSIAGMELSPLVQELKSDMPSSGGLRPGDVIISSHIDGSSDATYANGLAIDEFIDLATLAHAQSKKVDALVLRKGATGGPVAISGLDPKVALPDNKYGFGIGVGVDETLPRVAGVAPGSPAAEAEIPRGATITNVDGVAIYNWFQVRNALTVPGEHLLNFTMPNGEERSANMTLSAAAAGDIAALTLISDLVREGELRPLTEPRKTSNPLIAAAWGVTETRDLILQFYATLTRMAEGSVPAGSMMGPLGIIGAGAGFAERGIDWLIWFLALISANLAVVNFLPIITIADGGLFMFLVVEKVRGRPLAARTQAAFQFFGLVLIISVFLMVTYHDILRMLHPLR